MGLSQAKPIDPKPLWVIGAGSEEANGRYTIVDREDGAPVWRHDNGTFVIHYLRGYPESMSSYVLRKDYEFGIDQFLYLGGTVVGEQGRAPQTPPLSRESWTIDTGEEALPGRAPLPRISFDDPALSTVMVELLSGEGVSKDAVDRLLDFGVDTLQKLIDVHKGDSKLFNDLREVLPGRRGDADRGKIIDVVQLSIDLHNILGDDAERIREELAKKQIKSAKTLQTIVNGKHGDYKDLREVLCQEDDEICAKLEGLYKAPPTKGTKLECLSEFAEEEEEEDEEEREHADEEGEDETAEAPSFEIRDQGEEDAILSKETAFPLSSVSADAPSGKTDTSSPQLSSATQDLQASESDTSSSEQVVIKASELEVFRRKVSTVEDKLKLAEIDVQTAHMDLISASAVRSSECSRGSSAESAVRAFQC